MLHAPTRQDEEALDAAKKLHSMVQSLGNACVAATARNPVHAMLILSQAANGLLHLLGKVVMRDHEGNAVSSAATLYAALVSYECGPYADEGGKVVSEFSPLVLFEALKDMEKLTGKQPDDDLDETLCRVARECAADPAVVAHVRQQRAAAFGGSRTLN